MAYRNANKLMSSNLCPKAMNAVNALNAMQVHPASLTKCSQSSVGGKLQQNDRLPSSITDCRQSSSEPELELCDSNNVNYMKDANVSANPQLKIQGSSYRSNQSGLTDNFNNQSKTSTKQFHPYKLNEYHQMRCNLLKLNYRKMSRVAALEKFNRDDKVSYPPPFKSTHSNKLPNGHDKVTVLIPPSSPDGMSYLDFNKYNHVTDKIKNDLLNVDHLLNGGRNGNQLLSGKSANEFDHQSKQIRKDHETPSSSIYEYYKSPNKRGIVFDSRRNAYYPEHVEKNTDPSHKRSYQFLNDLMDLRPKKNNSIIMGQVPSEEMYKSIQDLKKIIKANLDSSKSKNVRLKKDLITLQHPMPEMHRSVRPFQATRPPFKIESPFVSCSVTTAPQANATTATNNPIKPKPMNSVGATVAAATAIANYANTITNQCASSSDTGGAGAAGAPKSGHVCFPPRRIRSKILQN